MPLDPPQGVKALLFDCDGTLVDTVGLYKICWHQVFGRHGFDMSDEWYLEWSGHTMQEFLEAAFPGSDQNVKDVVAQEGISVFLESIHLLEPLEHVVDVARRYHGTLPIVVVSGGPRKAVVESLAAVGIKDLFDDIITADDVAAGKPAPDAYLLAMSRLGLAPDEVAVYEDSSAGMRAATAAGIATIFDVRKHQE